MSAGAPRSGARGGIAITGLGAVTAVGATLDQTATSLQAGVQRMVERPLAGEGGEPPEEGGVYLAASAEALAASLGSADPVALALAALREAFWDAGLYEPGDVDAAYRRIALSVHLALPYAEAPGAVAVDTFVEGAVAAGLLAEEPAVEVVPFRNGHAGALLALESAAARLQGGEIDVALVGGLDATLDPARIAELNRLSKLRTDRAAGGAVPGEGTAFLVVERLADARRRGARFAAAVESVSRDTETVPLDGTRPGRADGATRAVTRALGAAPSARRVEEIWCDLNGERSRALEWGFLETRALSALGGARRQTPAAFAGDLGSSSGALLLALAAHALRTPRGAGGAALVCGASERGERAAAVLAIPRAGGEG
ncbi:MAG TPA: beta-ketoacyl synthase N-terminal-like domain-containing protein [Thermoanaerobaculia bacterium]|nr:beta-ketoacyl synthase N-terminal-like domain-containing protein [Thermoanaerobaculia bacterium]HQN08634.1 beta-ketoacyl synthase N-terminal-like domain-containing protein [Thermoanaerobaculia bacterium]HQP84934.1 beta-ketoacyl synthase N-terminal-like domain-containing protein [Thermoanaerobaculia bacterium]